MKLFTIGFTRKSAEMFFTRLAAAGVKRLIDVRLHDLRGWATGRHRTVDDYPFGGGAGMVMKPEPLVAAIDAVQAQAEPRALVVLLTPQGRPLDLD